MIRPSMHACNHGASNQRLCLLQYLATDLPPIVHSNDLTAEVGEREAGAEDLFGAACAWNNWLRERQSMLVVDAHSKAGALRASKFSHRL